MLRSQATPSHAVNAPIPEVNVAGRPVFLHFSSRGKLGINTYLELLDLGRRLVAIILVVISVIILVIV